MELGSLKGLSRVVQSLLYELRIELISVMDDVMGAIAGRGTRLRAG